MHRKATRSWPQFLIGKRDPVFLGGGSRGQASSGRVLLVGFKGNGVVWGSVTSVALDQDRGFLGRRGFIFQE